jgi:outer membrane protein assembly factor BamB
MVSGRTFARGLSVVIVAGLALAIAARALGSGQVPSADAARARQVLDAAGVRGGLVVHLGCGDGRLTAALRASDSYLIHGLDADAASVERAREYIRSLGLYGPVSVERWAGSRLPYADDFVNLLVISDAELRIPEAEVMRVLAPLGVACVKTGGRPAEAGGEGGWTKTVKPWPKDIDEWTHWLHDATGNAVARDTRVGPPRRMQWVADPLWSRGHEVTTSVGAAVTARGRIVYTLDEGQPGIYALPSKWVLVARDAFNGVLLWKRPLPHWGSASSSGGFGNGFRPRRLVTDGERIFLPMGEEAVLTSLDAATGKSLKALQEARGTSEILCADGLLVAVSSPQAGAGGKGKKGPAAAPTLFAARPDTLEVLWKMPAAALAGETLALGPGRVFFMSGGDVVALDAKSGREAWRMTFAKPAADGSKKSSGATLMVHGAAVYVQGGARLAALAADTGKVVWNRQDAPSSRGELFAAGGLLWRTQGAGAVGHDPATGEVRRTADASDVFTAGHHPRCYPSKATERYIITHNRGAEFVSLAAGENVENDWLRGNCGHGVMPANGLLYAPPNQCMCYPGVLLTGFKALAAGPAPAPAADAASDTSRLERGAAYEAISNLKSEVSDPSDWPTYRHDPSRFGSTAAAVPAGVKPLWQAAVGGRLTPPVAAGGMLLVAARDADTLYAFDAKDGRPLWTFTAGGRIDSPPTVHEGLVLMGSADGCVYCLRAADGALAWRFRAAPEDRRIGAFGRVESAWPVHGSVLVLKGVAYVTAGRSTYLDGGIFAYGLDPRSGRILHYARLAGAAAGPGTVPSDGKSPYVQAFHVEGARDDLLVTDGTFLYMGPLKLDAKLASQPTPYIAPTSKTTGLDLSNAPYIDTGVYKTTREKGGEMTFPALGVLRGPMGDKMMGLRMLATGGFLDDTYFNRTFWMYSKVWPGFYIGNLGAKTGELLVVDAGTTYGVQAHSSRTIHSPLYAPGTKGYILFADDNSNEPVLDDRTRDRDKGMGYTRGAPPKWFQWVPVRVRAMVAAGPTLFVAGPPDVMDPADPYAAFEGRKGALLWALAAADGKKLAEVKLSAEPVFDGLIAAGGRLYICTLDGRLTCLGEK